MPAVDPPLSKHERIQCIAPAAQPPASSPYSTSGAGHLQGWCPAPPGSEHAAACGAAAALAYAQRRLRELGRGVHQHVPHYIE